MERLTMRNDRGMAFWRDLQSTGGGYRMTEDKKDQDRLDRLAAYEDTMPIERAQELAQAEKDGRLVVLPCKAGTPVWEIGDFDGGNLKRRPFSVEDMSFWRFGITVFRTREEAETALKNREEA